MAEIKVPDIGDFQDVPIIEVHVKPGDEVQAEDPLVTLESDKATMDVPAPRAGKIAEVKVKVGDTVSEGTVIVTMESADEAEEEKPKEEKPKEERQEAPKAVAPSAKKGDVHAEVLVLGAGPGGYTAAFRAADLGKKVVLVERWPMLGGVCLNVGCIPSKALLHAAKVIDEAEAMSAHGIAFQGPKIDLDRLRAWKDGVVNKLVGGLGGLAKQRKVTVVQGYGRFTSPNEVEVEHQGKKQTVSFDTAIIAAGSEPATLPFIPDDPRIVDSTGALELREIPKRLLVLGGGIIGLEMATVYHALGSRITVVELMDQIIPGCDRDIVGPLHKRIAKQYEAIHLKTKVTKIEAKKSGLEVHMEGGDGKATFDGILVAVGRRPNGDRIDAEAAGVKVERGLIPVDRQMRTNVEHIFAVGDVVGQPMLAHKGLHEGKVAAEAAAGHKAFFDAKVIPSVAYTDPEVAWAGLTETEAKESGTKYQKSVSPWAASGRSLALGRDEGLTKLLFDPETERVLGCGIVGPSAGDLVAEVALAIEMGADAHDIGLTVHPHPTLSETIGLAAESFAGTITDLMPPKRR
jgi:dihydrolipoamide dehydrogenase